MILALITQAAAHPATPSQITLDVGRHEVAVSMALPCDQLEMALLESAHWDPEGPLPDSDEVTAYVMAHTRLLAGGAPLAVSEPALRWDTDGDETMAVVSFSASAAQGISDLELFDEVISERVRSHRGYVTLRGDVSAGVDHEATLIGTISATRRTLPIPLAAPPSTGSIIGSSLSDGFTHIVAGTDHLLFLLELLLVVPLVAVGGRWQRGDSPLRSLLVILSAFTCAHTATLVLLGLGWLSVAPSWVEAWVAGSILLGALHLIRPLWAGREAAFAGAAGLVHGAAFAEGLVGSALPTRELVLPLVSFSAGIELAQLGIALVTAPLWWWGARLPALRVGIAALAAVAAVGWLSELRADDGLAPRSQDISQVSLPRTRP